MNKLNAVIVEDVHENIETLAFLLNESNYDVDVIGTADNLTDAKSLLLNKSHAIDIAFLDIQLKEGVIFEVLDQLLRMSSINYDVVFVTAHTNFEYATKAIQFACLDYITKPISSEALEVCLEKTIQNKIRSNSSDTQIQYLIDLMKENATAPKSMSIALTKGVIELVELSQVNYLKADENTCIVHRLNEEPLHSTKSFSHYIDLLSHHPDFVQVSRNTLVNVTQVKRYDHREKLIFLKNGEKTYASHRYSKYFKDIISTYGPQEGGLQGMIDQFKRLFK